MHRARGVDPPSPPPPRGSPFCCVLLTPQGVCQFESYESMIACNNQQRLYRPILSLTRAELVSSGALEQHITCQAGQTRVNNFVHGTNEQACRRIYRCLELLYLYGHSVHWCRTSLSCPRPGRCTSHGQYVASKSFRDMFTALAGPTAGAQVPQQQTTPPSQKSHMSCWR